jgi:ATP-dependent RNA helicase DHX29
MADHPIPEMLRLSLQDLALRIKTLTIFTGSIEEVLGRALDKPLAVNVQRAILALQEVKALTSEEKITPLGAHLVKLPLDVHLGKFLLLACLFQCLDPALTIAAALSSKSPFVTPFGRESEAEAVKRAFKTENSDFLTLHRVRTFVEC